MSYRDILSIVTVALASLMLLGCTEQRKDLGPQIIIADADAEQSAAAASVRPGDNIVLRLPVMGGTGYKWRTARKPAYEWNMMILDEKMESATTQPTPGGGGWQVFRMRATKPGMQAIDFVYDRSWEGKAMPAKKFTLNLEVVKS